MATRFVLPSGAEVTRAWNGEGFRFELHTVTGPPVVLLPEDVHSLNALVELRELQDVETFEQSQEPPLKYETANDDGEDTKP